VPSASCTTMLAMAMLERLRRAHGRDEAVLSQARAPSSYTPSGIRHPLGPAPALGGLTSRRSMENENAELLRPTRQTAQP